MTHAAVIPPDSGSKGFAVSCDPMVAVTPGVYGLRTVGLDADGLLSTVPAASPVLTVACRRGQADGWVEQYGADGAEIPLVDGGWVSLSRDGNAQFIVPTAIAPEELLHPWLVPAAATFNGWLGRQVLHGGVIAREGRAIAILGAKESGKSSLFAWLAAREGFEILADDLVIVENGEVFAGPRCIDLREGSIRLVQSDKSRRLVRDASRLRLELPPCSASAHLAGVVVLGWSGDDELRMRSLAPSEAITALLPHALGGGAAGLHGRLLELLDLPCWSLDRPRRWDVMPAVEWELSQLLNEPRLGTP